MGLATIPRAAVAGVGVSKRHRRSAIHVEFVEGSLLQIILGTEAVGLNGEGIDGLVVFHLLLEPTQPMVR